VQAQGAGDDQVLEVRRVLRVVDQREGAARHHRAQVAASPAAAAGRAGGFHAGARQVAAFVGVAVVARPLVHLLRVVARVARHAGRLPEPGARLGEVEIVGDPLARFQVLDAAEMAAVLLVDLVARRVVADGVIRLALERLVSPRVVHQHQPVGTLPVLEEVVDAELLHQPRDEFEVGLAVLDLEHPLGVAVGDALFRRKAVVGEHLLDDLQHRLVLEDPVVAGAGRQDQPGPQDDFVDAPAVLVLHEARAGDQAVDLARAGARARRNAEALAVQRDADAELLADSCLTGTLAVTYPVSIGLSGVCRRTVYSKSSPSASVPSSDLNSSAGLPSRLGMAGLPTEMVREAMKREEDTQWTLTSDRPKSLRPACPAPLQTMVARCPSTDKPGRSAK
jgi:hypothetical protein